MLSFFRELKEFLMARGKWWLFPILILLVVLGAILFFASSSAVAPFIYTVF